VIAWQDEYGKTAEVGEKAYGFFHDGIINLVVLKQVAGDYKCIHLAVESNLEGTTQGRESRLAQFAGPLAELLEASTKLPVCGVENFHALISTRIN
jgi:hypothetical protein